MRTVPLFWFPIFFFFFPFSVLPALFAKKGSPLFGKLPLLLVQDINIYISLAI